MDEKPKSSACARGKSSAANADAAARIATEIDTNFRSWLNALFTFVFQIGAEAIVFAKAIPILNVDRHSTSIEKPANG